VECVCPARHPGRKEHLSEIGKIFLVTDHFTVVVSYPGGRNEGTEVHILIDSSASIMFYSQGVLGGVCRIHGYINP
jgi:hypothetical protein